MRDSEDSNTGRIEILEERENPFPDDVEGRLNAILNVVNTELKTLTLLHLDDRYANESEIKSRLRDTVGNGTYLPSNGSFGNYCLKSLFPIGAVAQGDIRITNARGPRHFAGYRLTEAGRKYGRPIAAFTLDYVSRTGMSMFEILRSTVSPGKTRAPLNRVKILKILESEGELRQADLVDFLNLDYFTPIGVISLSEIGFINCESVGERRKNAHFVSYGWVHGKRSEEARTVASQVSLTKNIAEALFTSGELNRGEILQLLDNPHNPSVSSVISGLKEQGLVRIVSKWSVKEMSRIRLLEPGKRFLVEYIEPIEDSLQDGLFLSQTQEFYDSLVNDEQRFTDVSITGVESYRKVSPNIYKRPKEETNRRIIIYLIEKPGSRQKEIFRGLNLSSNPGTYLTPLIKLGILRKEKEGAAVRYFVDETKAREMGLLV